MKKLLILIIAAALFLHFYPQPKLESWYQQQKAFVLQEFSGATDTQVRLKADKIFSDLEPQFASFSPDELIYLKEITSTRDAVKSFYQDYCKRQQQAAKLHPSNQTKVCHTIDNYQSFL